jgi:hypothetical protein
MIENILHWLGVPTPIQQLNELDLFLAGHSIPAISAAAGHDIIREQRRIEQLIRDYVLDLERQIADLQRTEQ